MEKWQEGGSCRPWALRALLDAKASSSSFFVVKKYESKLSIFYSSNLAGEAGIEPTSMVLETTILTVVLLPYVFYYIIKNNPRKGYF